jgi:8-oxo-dGTP pyrophosphatase MutT (NUDIX family)
MSTNPSATPTYTVGQWLAAPARIARPADIPRWLTRLVAALGAADPAQLTLNDPPATHIADRQAAVLILLTDTPDGPEVTLLQRSDTPRHHPGEVAFPGGGREPTDCDAAATAVREAAEEIGADPASVDPIMTLPRLLIRASGFDVTGVIAHWRRPGPVHPVHPAETARVLNISLPDLADPARWDTYQTRVWNGPATFIDASTRLWGYTAEILLYMARHLCPHIPGTRDHPAATPRASHMRHDPPPLPISARNGRR